VWCALLLPLEHDGSPHGDLHVRAHLSVRVLQLWQMHGPSSLRHIDAYDGVCCLCVGSYAHVTSWLCVALHLAYLAAAVCSGSWETGRGTRRWMFSLVIMSGRELLFKALCTG
jgi:hypothetical protein